MKKQVKFSIKLELKGGEANPGLKQIGPALGGKIGNIMDFCKQFNSQTEKGKMYRVLVSAYDDKEKSFTFVLRGSPTAILLMNKASLTSGSGEPNRKKVGSIKLEDVVDIAREQLPNLNAFDIDKAVPIIIGTAKRMGLEVK